MENRSAASGFNNWSHHNFDRSKDFLFCKYILRNRFIICVFLLLSQHSVFSKTNNYEYKVPQQLNDGWEVSSLKAEGINTKAIEEITEQIKTESRFRRIYSMLIIKNGKLVHEAYFAGRDRNSLHVMASITKSVTSTLIGIAIDKGFIKSVNEGVFSLLPQYAKGIKDPKKKDIKLKHLLTMSSGLEWIEYGVSYDIPKNSEYQMVATHDWVKFVLTRTLKDTPGTRFNYNTGGLHVLSAVIKSTTGLDAKKFAEKYLFEPLGMIDCSWNTDPMGYQCTGGTDGGVGLTSRDLAKFGWLFFRDGTWKGKRIISQAWIKEATKKHLDVPNNINDYGYCWWPGLLKIKGKTFNHVASFGYGGQTLYLVPELDLILVFTCQLTDKNTNVFVPILKTFQAVIQDQ